MWKEWTWGPVALTSCPSAPIQPAPLHIHLWERGSSSPFKWMLVTTVALGCLDTDIGYTSSCLATILISGAFKPQLINVLILGLMPRGSFVTYTYRRGTKQIAEINPSRVQFLSFLACCRGLWSRHGGGAFSPVLLMGRATGLGTLHDSLHCLHISATSSYSSKSLSCSQPNLLTAPVLSCPEPGSSGASWRMRP